MGADASAGAGADAGVDTETGTGGAGADARPDGADAGTPPENTPPTAGDLDIVVVEGAQNNVGRLPSSDVDGDPLVHRIISNGAKGSATLGDLAGPDFKYASTAGGWGEDSFDYQVNDGHSDARVPGKVRVLVLPAGPLRVPSAPLDTESSLGHELEIDGETAIVGTIRGPIHGGGALIARRQPDGSWSFVQRLTAGERDAQVGRFGESVALSGDWAIVGAWGDWPPTDLPGRIFFFKRSPGGDFQLVQDEPCPEPRQLADGYGHRVKTDGQWAVVTKAAGPDAGDWAGAVDVWKRGADDRWTYHHDINGNAGGEDLFGIGFDLETTNVPGESRLVIGASVEGDGGALHVFRLGTEERHTLFPSLAGGTACEHVALSGDTVLCSAKDLNQQRGAAFVFSLSGGSEKIIEPPPEAVPTLEFGLRVALDGDTAVVVAREAQARDLEPSRENIVGFAYRRVARGTAWKFIRRLRVGAPEGRLFLPGLAVDGTTILATNGAELGMSYWFNVALLGTD